MSSSNNITFYFKILKLNVLPSYKIGDTELLNVVTSIVYQYIGETTDGKNCIITAECPLSKPTMDSYTDFHNLNESDVITWLKSNVNENKFKLDITNYLNGNNVVEMELPWIIKT